MAEMKKDNVTVNNDNIDEKEKQGSAPEAPAEEKTEAKKEGLGQKIGGFFKKNGKKIGVGIGLAAAFAGGLAAEKIGFGFKKTSNDQTEENPEG